MSAHFTKDVSSFINFLLSCSCLLLLTAVLTKFDGVIFGGFSLLFIEPNKLSFEGTKIPGLGILDTKSSLLPSIFLRSFDLFLAPGDTSLLPLCPVVVLKTLFVLFPSSVLDLFLLPGA